MVSVVQMGLAPGDRIVLVDPTDSKVVEYFNIEEITPFGQAAIRDSQGYLFVSDMCNDEMWLHQHLMLKFPAEIVTRSTRAGYKHIVGVHVNNFHRIHFAGFLKENKPHIFSQLPEVI